MTYREIVYACLDILKLTSDDSLYTEEHIIFLANKARTLLLKQRYSDIKKRIPESNYQTICLDLEKVQNIQDLSCQGSSLRTVQEVPYLMKIGNPKVYPQNYYLGEITYISRERMRYVGHNKYLQNIIYCSLAPDNHLYFKSSNPQHLYLKKVQVTGIFEDIQNASQLECSDNNSQCQDILDKTFPLEEALVQPLIEIVVKQLGPSVDLPQDQENNAQDDLAKNNK